MFSCINVSFERISTKQLYSLPNPCEFISTIGKNFILVLKALMLDCKICVSHNKCHETSNWLQLLLSFIPNSLFQANKELMNVGFTNNYKKSILHCPLSELRILDNIKINLIGVTSWVFRDSVEFDCIITEKGIKMNSKLKKIITITKSDKEFIKDLLIASNSNNYKKCYELIMNYYLGLIVTANKTQGKWVLNDDITDYGSEYINSFKQTELFKNIPSKLEISCLHPSRTICRDLVNLDTFVVGFL